MVIAMLVKLLDTLSWSKILAFLIVFEGFVLAFYDKINTVAILSVTVPAAAGLVGLKTYMAEKNKAKEEANG